MNIKEISDSEVRGWHERFYEACLDYAGNHQWKAIANHLVMLGFDDPNSKSVGEDLRLVRSADTESLIYSAQKRADLNQLALAQIVDAVREKTRLSCAEAKRRVWYALRQAQRTERSAIVTPEFWENGYAEWAKSELLK